MTIPKPTKGTKLNTHSEELKEHNSNSQVPSTPEEKQVKLKKNVDLFSGIALIVGTMIGKLNHEIMHEKLKFLGQGCVIFAKMECLDYATKYSTVEPQFTERALKYLINV